MKKIIISLALVLCIILCSSVSSKACDKTAGCNETRKDIACGTQHGDYAFAHYIGEVNGTGIYCQVYYISAYHTITCHGCGAYLYTEIRKCGENHSACGDSHLGECDYQ